MQTEHMAIGEVVAKRARSILLLSLGAILLGGLAFAQGPPPSYPPQELDRLVSRIALYPDPLLAQILAAATFPDQIQDAARWADQHHYVTGDALARDIQDDHLPWDPSVQALLPFPSVLGMMASDMNWTSELGNAFMAQNAEVMDAVQRMRRSAMDSGYLRSGPQVVVRGGPYIEIVPVNPAFIYVPYYDPLLVFGRPRYGAVAGITFRFGVAIGPAFRPWGWGYNHFGWNEHTVYINNNPWHRTYVNRGAYVHPYPVQRYEPARRVEEHQLHERTEREREAVTRGRGRVEDHRHVEDRRQDHGREEEHRR